MFGNTHIHIYKMQYMVSQSQMFPAVPCDKNNPLSKKKKKKKERKKEKKKKQLLTESLAKNDTFYPSLLS